MRYIKLAAFVFMAVASTAAMSQAQEMHAMKKGHSMGMSMSKTGKTTTLEGQVIGLNCYLSTGAHGASAEACQLGCVKSGLPIGILTRSGEVYLATRGVGKTANSLLVPYMEKEVRVTGWVHARGGMHLVVVKSVVPVKSKTMN